MNDAPPARRPERTPLKTYSHLSGARPGAQRTPDDYDLSTADLLYYLRRDFALTLPLSEWYRTHQRGSPLFDSNWEAFVDPRRTTYTRYVRLAQERETRTNALLQAIDDTGSDRTLAANWVAVLDRFIGPLRYPLHALQMVSAYLGSMAPSGRVGVFFLLQTADELRRVQLFAQRMVQLADTHPRFGAGSKGTWQEDPALQPLRELVERLLVTYDYGEAMVALCLCVKPFVDGLLGAVLPEEAERREDPLLSALLRALAADTDWHRDVAARLIAIGLAGDPRKRHAASAWLARWQPLVARAAAPLDFLFASDGPARVRALIERVEGRAAERLAAAGEERAP